MNRFITTLAMSCAAWMVCASAAPAQITLWLDFGAGWQTQLDAAMSPGSEFDATERALIESNIATQVSTIFSAYNVVVVASDTDPGGDREHVNFAATSGMATALGLAPLDPGNTSQNDIVQVFTANFGNFVEPADPRSEQIAEISTALAGTASHELGHSFGLQHHDAYGTTGITPANYANTGGLQNVHIMATGSTGLDEAGREMLRTLSPWSRVLLDVTGGTLFNGDALSPGGPPAEQVEVSDAGGTTATAASRTLTTGATSGMEIALLRGEMDSINDVDVYSFDVTSAGLFSAEVWSQVLFADAIDSVLTLFDTDGSTVLATTDDTRYDGNQFGSGTFQTTDSFLNNIIIPTAGTYFLQIAPFGNETVGDNYEVVVGFAPVPEPGSLMLLSLLALGWTCHRRVAAHWCQQR